VHAVPGHPNLRLVGLVDGLSNRNIYLFGTRTTTILSFSVIIVPTLRLLRVITAATT
jgi:hypothetical protein